MQKAFTLIELLVVVSIIALLIAILLPVLSSTRESARIVLCLSYQKQMATSSQAFAVDDGLNRLIPARLHGGSYVQHALNYGTAAAAQSESFHAGVEAFEDYGFLPEMLADPGRDFTPYFRSAFQLQVHAYQYFGGIERWKNLPGSVSSIEGLSPVVIDDLSSDVALVACHAIKQSQATPWGQSTEDQFVDSPAHGISSGEPLGGNHVFGDGSGRWVDFDDYLQLHTWGAGRVAFYYQKDLGDYMPPAP